jgi:hypothetical protein
MSPFAFLLVTCVGCLAVVLRGRAGRFEQLGVALFIVVVACVGGGGLLSSSIRSDAIADGRGLIPCVLGPLLALSWRSELAGRISGPLVGVVATMLLLLGLGSHTSVLAAWRLAPIAVVGALGLAALAALSAALASLVRARTAATTLWRYRLRTEAAGVGVVGLAAMLAGAGAWWPLPATDAWPAVIGMGAALATLARAGASPPSVRDAAAAVIAATAAAAVAQTGTSAIVAAAVVVTGAVIGVGILGVPALRSTTSGTRAISSAVPASVFGVAPILDDESMRRPTRPRVLTRSPARRIVDAAIERAWRSSPQTRGQPPIDVIGGENVDIDGDASELAEALCALLDHALRTRAPDATDRMTVSVRAAAATVALELDGVALPAQGVPFLDADNGALALFRARLLVERHGGQLHVHGAGRGSVHVTLPRRVQRGGVGLA